MVKNLNNKVFNFNFNKKGILNIYIIIVKENIKLFFKNKNKL